MKRGWTFIETLLVIAVLTLIGIIALPMLLFKPVTNGSEMVTKGRIQGAVTPLSEFTYDGCQYLHMDRGITHKGNCTNTIHLHNN